MFKGSSGGGCEHKRNVMRGEVGYRDAQAYMNGAPCLRHLAKISLFNDQLLRETETPRNRVLRQTATMNWDDFQR